MSTRILTLLILVCFTAAGALFAQQSTFPEKIVFGSDMDGDFDIWMINPDGTELEVLIDRPGNQSFPRISPDGTKIAFFDAPDPSSGQRDIVVRDLAAGTDLILDTGFPGKPSVFEWVGDNSGVVARNIGLNCTGDPLAFVPLSGGNIPLFAEGGRRLTVMAVDEARDVLYYTSDPCWSPNTEVKRYDFANGQRSLVQAADGRLEGGGDIHGDDFVFYKAVSGYSNGQIHLMTVDGFGERALSSGTGLVDAGPRFSPDARQVVFFRRESNSDIDIYTLDIPTLVETPLVLDPFNSANPDWGHILLDTCDADTNAPSIEQLLTSRDELWPPNHRMVEVTVDVVATDDCDSAPVCSIVAVASDEAVDGGGDGHTAPDWWVVDGSTVLLRAERDGDGDGRVYTIRVSCADAAGNATADEVTVSVPLSRGR